MASTNLVWRGREYVRKDQITSLPDNIRGIYALLDEEKRDKFYKVVYIGIGSGRSGIKARLRSHSRGRRGDKWTHFTFFEVWPNIPDSWLAEMEALFLHFFRKNNKRSGKTLKLNTRMKSLKLRRITSHEERFNPDHEEMRRLAKP